MSLKPVKTQLRRGGYTILKELATQSDKKQIVKDLTVTPATRGQMIGPPPNPFPVYMENRKRYYLPRYYGFETYGKPQSDILKDGEECPRLEFAGSLRDKQKPVIDIIKNSGGGGVISVPCGFGKTCCAIYMACWLKKKTLVVVHKNFLLTQWVERIQQFAPTAKIGRIQGKTIDVADKDIVIGMLQSLSMKDYPLDLFKQFGFTIIDECHHISAEVFSRALPVLGSRWNLGLSATPDRSDGLSRVFYWHLGPLLYPAASDISVTPVSGKGNSKQCVVKRIDYFHPDPHYCHEQLTIAGKPNTARMITQICTWYRRNILIVEILKMCIAKKRVILVLSDRRSMLDILNALILRIIPGVTVGKYVGGMKQKDLDASAQCDIILSTFAMSSEGMDIPRINTVILGSPKSNVEQPVGRAQRKKHADGVWIFDIVDQVSIFPRQWASRRAFYRKYLSTTSYTKERYPIENYKVDDGESDAPPEVTMAAAIRRKIPKERRSKKTEEPKLMFV